jgi:endoglucanase
VDFCAQNTAINANSDVYLGYIAWTAGSVTSDYILDLAPTLTGTTWVDQKMAIQCVIDVWVSATAGPAAPTWGLVLPTAVGAIPSSAVASTKPSSSAVVSTSSSAVVSTSSSAVVSTSSSATTPTAIMTSTGKSGSGSSTQTSIAPSNTQTKTPSSANGAKVASGLIACSLILAVVLM